MKPNPANETIAGNQETSFLKMLALVFMLVDHLGAAIYPGIFEMRIIGRMAFPLYAWCLVVGCVKTRSLPKYALRALGLALISQPLYMMALNHTWQDYNILFTLAIAIVAIGGIRWRKFGSEIWLPALCYLLLGFVKVDYGWRGLTFILILYFARNSRSGLISAYLAYALFWGTSSTAITQVAGIPLTFLQWPGIGTMLQSFFRLQGMIWLSLPLIALPTHTGLRMPQWMSYALYPMHLVVLILLRLANGISFEILTRGF